MCVLLHKESRIAPLMVQPFISCYGMNDSLSVSIVKLQWSVGRYIGDTVCWYCGKLASSCLYWHITLNVSHCLRDTGWSQGSSVNPELQDEECEGEEVFRGGGGQMLFRHAHHFHCLAKRWHIPFASWIYQCRSFGFCLHWQNSEWWFLCLDVKERTSLWVSVSGSGVVARRTCSSALSGDGQETLSFERGIPAAAAFPSFVPCSDTGS